MYSKMRTELRWVEMLLVVPIAERLGYIPHVCISLYWCNHWSNISLGVICCVLSCWSTSLISCHYATNKIKRCLKNSFKIQHRFSITRQNLQLNRTKFNFTTNFKLTVQFHMKYLDFLYQVWVSYIQFEQPL